MTANRHLTFLLFFFNRNTLWTVKHCRFITKRAYCLHRTRNNGLLFFIDLLTLLLYLYFWRIGTPNIHQALNQWWYSTTCTLRKNLKIYRLIHILITTFWNKSIKLYCLLFNTNSWHLISFFLMNFKLRLFRNFLNSFLISWLNNFVDLWKWFLLLNRG